MYGLAIHRDSRICKSVPQAHADCSALCTQDAGSALRRQENSHKSEACLGSMVISSCTGSECLTPRLFLIVASFWYAPSVPFGRFSVSLDPEHTPANHTGQTRGTCCAYRGRTQGKCSCRLHRSQSASQALQTVWIDQV